MATCNEAQHKDTRCMIDIAQRLLENAKQHTKTCAIEIERARQASLMIDVAQHAERHRVTCVNDQL
jgi:hypothetical protein